MVINVQNASSNDTYLKLKTVGLGTISKSGSLVSILLRKPISILKIIVGMSEEKM